MEHRYFGLDDKLRAAKRDCEKAILEAICEFNKATGLRVTNIIYDYNDSIDGNIREQSVTIDAKI